MTLTQVLITAVTVLASVVVALWVKMEGLRAEICALYERLAKAGVYERRMMIAKAGINERRRRGLGRT